MAYKHKISKYLISKLEPLGYKFQKDNGFHIYTSLSLFPPEKFKPEDLIAFLLKNGIKANSMWSSALSISEFSQNTWHVDPNDNPVAQNIAKRIIQLPVSRFQTEKQTRKIVNLCLKFIS